jgi:hypothetical protein
LADGTVVRGVVVLSETGARRAGDYERFVEALTADDAGSSLTNWTRGICSRGRRGHGLIGVAFEDRVRKVRRRMRRFHRVEAGTESPPGDQAVRLGGDRTPRR